MTSLNYDLEGIEAALREIEMLVAGASMQSELSAELYKATDVPPVSTKSTVLKSSCICCIVPESGTEPCETAAKVCELLVRSSVGNLLIIGGELQALELKLAMISPECNVRALRASSEEAIEKAMLNPGLLGFELDKPVDAVIAPSSGKEMRKTLNSLAVRHRLPTFFGLVKSKETFKTLLVLAGQTGCLECCRINAKRKTAARDEYRPLSTLSVGMRLIMAGQLANSALKFLSDWGQVTVHSVWEGLECPSMSLPCRPHPECTVDMCFTRQEEYMSIVD